MTVFIGEIRKNIFYDFILFIDAFLKSRFGDNGFGFDPISK